MTDLEILECAQSIYDFLVCDGDPSRYLSFNDIPSFKNMNTTLGKYNTDMVPFTHFLNDKYKIYQDPLWNKSGTEFFSTTKGHNFYKIILRELKLKLCLSCQK